MIRRAAERALAQGMRTAECLECLARDARAVAVPLVPMTYASLLEAYGWERFAADAHEAGATSLIVADLPVDAHPELRRVQLVAPTSTDERIALAAERTDGWLYLVTVAGTTGARAELSPALAPLVERARDAHGRPALRGLRHLDAGAGGRGRGDSRTASSSARPRSLAAEEGAASARALRRSAARRARLSDEPVARDVPGVASPASMCSKCPVCESTRSSHGSPACASGGRVARRDAHGDGVVAVAVQDELRDAEREALARRGEDVALEVRRSGRRAAPGSASTTA